MSIDTAVFHTVHTAAKTATTERRASAAATAEAIVEDMTLEQLRAAVTALVRIAAHTGSQVVGEDASPSDFQENLDLLVDEGLRGTGLPSVSSGDHGEYWSAAHGLPSEKERHGVNLTDDTVVHAAARALINELSPAFDPETLKLDLHDMAARAGVRIAEERSYNNVLQVRGKELEIQLAASQDAATDRAVIASALGLLYLEHLPATAEKGGNRDASYAIVLCPNPGRPWQCVFAAALVLPEAAFRAAVEETVQARKLARTFDAHPQMVRARAAALGIDLAG